MGGEERMKAGLSMQDIFCCSEQIVGGDQID